MVKYIVKKKIRITETKHLIGKVTNKKKRASF